MNLARLPETASGRWKLAAIVVAGVPVAMLVAFTLGESASGDLSGLTHLVQLAPLVALLAAAWRWPLPAGAALVAIAVVLSALYAALASDNIAIGALVAVELVFFVPAVLAGLLFIRAGRLGARGQ